MSNKDKDTSNEDNNTAASASEDKNDNIEHTSNTMAKTAKKTTTAARTKKAALTKTGSRKSTGETINSDTPRRRNGAPWLSTT
jgi:hypothetical protein